MVFLAVQVMPMIQIQFLNQNNLHQATLLLLRIILFPVSLMHWRRSSVKLVMMEQPEMVTYPIYKQKLIRGVLAGVDILWMIQIWRVGMFFNKKIPLFLYLINKKKKI